MGCIRRGRGLLTVVGLALFLSAGGAGCAAKGPDPKLSARLDDILHRRDDGKVHYGARVVELRTGREIYLHDPDQALMPASNGKLSVTSAGLDWFGPDHIFKTWFAMDGDDLWIIGTGDPSVGDNKIAKTYKRTTMSVLEDWAEVLKAKKIQRIKGNLYFYEGAMEAEQINPTWSKGFAGDWYAAPVGGLNFNDNCIDVTVTPTAPGQPAQYTVVPPTREIKIVNQAMTSRTARGDGPDISRETDANVFTIKGSATRPTELQSKSVLEPGAFFADALRTHLASKGIVVEGITRRADKPLGGKLEPPKKKVLATHESKMSDVMWRINKDSQNMFAEAMCKNLGREYVAKVRPSENEPGSWANGAEAVKVFLAREGIDSSKLVIVDGSGLSREDRVTARLISEIFAKMWRHKYHEAFFNSLTWAGHDGTLRNRLKDLPTEFHGKTGYIGGVRSLSGYVKTTKGEWLAVSMIFNGFEGSTSPIESMQDDAVRVLAQWPDVPPATQPSPTTRLAAGAR